MGLFSRVSDTAFEIKDHREFTQDVKDAIASGDKEAASTFRTGSLSSALTRKGSDARGAEIAEYVAKVVAADGNADRIGWLRRR